LQTKGGNFQIIDFETLQKKPPMPRKEIHGGFFGIEFIAVFEEKDMKT
jgi:hypothetical protein